MCKACSAVLIMQSARRRGHGCRPKRKSVRSMPARCEAARSRPIYGYTRSSMCADSKSNCHRQSPTFPDGVREVSSDGRELSALTHAKPRRAGPRVALDLISSGHDGLTIQRPPWRHYVTVGVSRWGCVFEGTAAQQPLDASVLQ